VVVLETGLGGRLDSTNIIESSLLSVITGIDLDHTAILGDTVEQIAAEKAGIIKHACPVLFGGAGGESAERVIRKIAEEQSAPYAKTNLSRLSVASYSLSGTSLSFGAHRDLTLPLLGTYQPQNLANVLSAIDLLTARGSLHATEAHIRQGLASVLWHARFEMISTDPVIIFDGSHNPQGISSAAESIRRYFPDCRVNLLTGVMADKQYDGMIETLAPLANRVFTVTPNNPRSLNSHRYAECFRAHGVEATGFDTVTDGLREAIRYSKETDTPLICLGSLYLYGEIMEAFRSLSC
jgi:dihydrofolate synthase/folylpolyglutamate synthase